MARKPTGSCSAIPEDPWRYFTRPPGAVLTRLGALSPQRARAGGITNAREHMRIACDGGPKRDPITICPDGSIYDGNSTYAVAVESGWESIPTQTAVWTKVSSHRARGQVTAKLGYSPQSHYSMKKRVPAATSYYWLSPKEFELVSGINGVTRARYQARDEWQESISMLSNPAEIVRSDYPSVFDDSDRDSIPDVDDPHPFAPGDTKSIEEVRLSDEIGHLIDARDAFVPATESVMQSLRDLKIPQSKVEGRVKTPYSIVNKLRRKRLGTLTDVAATRIVVPDKSSLDKVVAAIERDFEILDSDDYYKAPQDGYRAMHYIVRQGGMPVEVQVKTKRLSQIADASHTPYKRGELDHAAMDRLTSLAVRADAGNAAAQRELDPLLKDKAALKRVLTVRSNPRATRKARRLANP